MIDVALDSTTLHRWRSDPLSFVEEVLHDPETGKPFSCWRPSVSSCGAPSRSMATVACCYPELVYGAPKKSGKTTLAALIVLVMVLLRNDGRFAEAYCVANDFEQAQSRVFAVIRRIVEVSPLLKHEAKITADRIMFPALDATHHGDCVRRGVGCRRQPGDLVASMSCGATPRSARRRLWDEMITSPARKISCRLTMTYAGFAGESVLLEELHKRGHGAADEVGPSLRAGDGMLFAWHTEPVAPWQDERWLAEMRRSLRPSAYARMIMNEFVSPESKFVDLAAWDACVQPSLVPVVQDRSLRSGSVSMPRPSETAPRWLR